jgi:hypothetical protein
VAGSAHFPTSAQVPRAARRNLLTLLEAAPVVLLAGCNGAVAPRDYERPRSHITGRGGNNGKSGGHN